MLLKTKYVVVTPPTKVDLKLFSACKIIRIETITSVRKD